MSRAGIAVIAAVWLAAAACIGPAAAGGADARFPDHRDRQSAHRRRHDPLVFSCRAGRPIRRRSARCRAQGTLRHRPVRRCEDLPRGKSHPGGGGRKSHHRSRRFRGQQKAQRRRSQSAGAVQSQRAAVARTHTKRRRPHSRSLSGPRLFQRAGRAEDDRGQARRQWPGESRVRDQGRRKARGQRYCLQRQYRLFASQAQRRGEDWHQQPAELSSQQRYLRCRPDRERQGPGPAFLSRAWLSGCAAVFRGAIRRRQEGRRRHVQDRRRAAISLRQSRHRVASEDRGRRRIARQSAAPRAATFTMRTRSPNRSTRLRSRWPEAASLSPASFHGPSAMPIAGSSIFRTGSSKANESISSASRSTATPKRTTK